MEFFEKLFAAFDFFNFSVVKLLLKTLAKGINGAEDI